MREVAQVVGGAPQCNVFCSGAFLWVEACRNLNLIGEKERTEEGSETVRSSASRIEVDLEGWTTDGAQEWDRGRRGAASR